MIKKSLSILSCLIFCVSMMNSQSFFEDVIGEWEGKGSLFGMEASFKMKWTNELEGKFVRLTFQNKFTDQNGIERIMDAHAYYDPSSSNGTWFDTHGMMLPLQLDIEENVLIVLWGNAETRQGKTIYTIDSTGEVVVEDFVKRNEAYTPFGSAKYRRISED